MFISLRIDKELILPNPLQVIITLGSLVKSGEFWQSALFSLLRIALGYIIGVLSGIILALLTICSKIADTLISPVIRVIRATPVASFIILVMLWLGKALVPTIMAGLMVMPIVWENIRAQYSAVDKNLVEMGRAFKFTKSKMLKLIYAPQILPGLSSGCIAGVGLAWKSGIAAEVLCQPELSIGANLYYSKIYLETPNLFAWTTLVIILSMILEKGLKLLLKKLFERRVSREN